MELLHLLASLQILPRLVSPAASLQAPTIIVDPQHPVYFPGERLTLRCLAPGGEAVTSYQFYNQHGEQVNTETTSLSGGPWLVLTAETGKTGAYSCEYWSMRDRRHICSTRSQPVLVPVMDFPLAPSISVISDPLGKSPVTILCSAPPRHVAKRYQFLKQGNVIVSQPGARLQLRQSDLDITGSYTCSYEISVSVRMIQSLPSAPLSIHLTAPPLAPKLSLHPKLPVYLPGEKVTLNCSAPRGEEVVGFRFHQHRGDQTPEELPAASGGPLMDLMAQTGNDGAYTCQYWRRETGQEIVSENSNSITVPVSDPPPQPVLSMDPPSRVVSEGLPLLIACAAPGDTNERRFHFYKDGAEIVARDVGSEISTTEPSIGSTNVSVLSIPRAGPESTGEFTCGYEKNMSGRWILSPRSWAVNLTVTAKISPGSIHAWPLWIYLAAGCIAAAALLPLLLLICLCRRRKGGVMAETQPVYVNRPSGAGTALQQWSHDGQVQPVTHNEPAWLNVPGGKPLVHRNPQERGKKEEDADARAINTVYSMVTPPSAVAKQRGGKYISEAVVYSKIPYSSQPLPPPRPTPR